MTPLYLILTIGILLSVTLLFFISSRKNRFNSTQKRDIINKLDALKKETHYRDGVIRLDTLFCKVLRKSTGYSGSCGEILSKTEYIFPGTLYQSLWDVHKIRNKVVHETHEINRKEYDEIYAIFRQGILTIISR